MTSEQFWPGDKVITLVEHEGIPVGTVGIIDTRWPGTIYSGRTKAGLYHWMHSTGIRSIDPNSPNLAVGDIAEVTSNRHQDYFANIGDLVQIVKIIEDADYYSVLLDGKKHWMPGFQLAPYVPPFVAP